MPIYRCENFHPSRLKIYEQNFTEINLESFDFSENFKYSDVQRFERKNISSINIIDLNFYQDQNKWKHNLIPIEISKNILNRVHDFLI